MTKYRDPIPFPQMALWLQDELIIDNFAGGGGASTGIEKALGRPVDIAINHDEIALDVHTLNHPQTRHYVEDIRDVDPRVITKGKPVALAWFSPDCRHHSKAKGGKPKKKEIRGLAWQVMKYAAMKNKPRVIILENVEEFADWGPLLETGQPDKTKLGITFHSFCRELKKRGYEVEHRILHAHHYGVPTSRKRLFLIARSDGQPIVWPQPTHGPGLKPYRTAAECIDWSLPGKSIFERKRPLADNTKRRIARCIDRFAIGRPDPFLIQIAHYSKGSKPRLLDLDKPLNTITDWPKGGSFALAIPVIARQFGTGTGHAVDEPFRTVMPGGGGKNQLVMAVLMKYYGTNTGHPLDQPLQTITAKDRFALVELKLDREMVDYSRQVSMLLMRYGADLSPWSFAPTTVNRFGLVNIGGEAYRIVDILLRMLQPHELYAAQGFPPDYIFNRGTDDKPIPGYKQTSMCGNSVCPALAEVLVRANLVDVPVLAGREAA